MRRVERNGAKKQLKNMCHKLIESSETDGKHFNLMMHTYNELRAQSRDTNVQEQSSRKQCKKKNCRNTDENTKMREN